MNETIYTIPLMDAFQAADECPFCFINRKLEQDSLDFILGGSSAYMQSDIRKKTNHYGFCSIHYNKMFAYGNSLGNALMLQSYISELKKNLHKKLNSFTPSKPEFFSRFKKDNSECTMSSIGSFCKTTTQDCFICRHIAESLNRYIDTFFFLLRSNEEFYDIFKNSKGFCLHHFGILIDTASTKLNARQLEDFQSVIFSQMEDSLNRLEEDISWFIDKFDYQNKDADWKNSKDAVQRCMQKITTGYPADTLYRSNR